MDQKQRDLVRGRADNRCEYCRLPQHLSPVARLQIEHIIPRKHGGGDEEQNLALACVDCNLSKSSNLSGIDDATGRIVELFHPRRQAWLDHFAWDGTRIIGLTPAGRATVRVLNLNSDARIRLRVAADYR